jgi:hypothetical protein
MWLKFCGALNSGTTAGSSFVVPLNSGTTAGSSFVVR